jgi:hypothetical protein
VSRRTEAKKARRDKRRAARDANWVPEEVLDEVVDNFELADVLEAFDTLVTQRGWTFDDENSDERGVAWFYEPSYHDDFDGPATTIWIHESDSDWVYLLLVGTTDGYRFEPEALLEHLDTIEAYRYGDPLPEFQGLDESLGPSTTP